MEDFTRRGQNLLAESSVKRQNIEQGGRHGGPRVIITRALKEESKALQEHIADLAAECGVLHGKASISIRRRCLYDANNRS